MADERASTRRDRYAALVLGLALLAAGAAGCSAHGQANSNGDQTPAPTAVASTTPPPTTTPPTTPSPTAPVLADGKHPVYLTKIDVSGHQLTFDLIQFLTGAAAKKAWVKDHPEYPDGPDNDYYIVNENPLLRTLPVSTTVMVKVVNLGAPGGVSLVSIKFADLPKHLSDNEAPAEGRLWHAPFWIVVSHGVIVSMEEQFLP
jgi:hypothetical protein